MLVNSSSLIAIQSYTNQQSLERSGSTTDRAAVKPGVISKTAERGLREPFVLVDLSEDAAATLAQKTKPQPAKAETSENKNTGDEPASNKFLREAPKANAQPVISRPGTNLDISI